MWTYYDYVLYRNSAIHVKAKFISLLIDQMIDRKLICNYFESKKTLIVLTSQ